MVEPVQYTSITNFLVGYEPLPTTSTSSLELSNFNISPLLVSQTMQHLTKLTLTDCRSSGGFRELWRSTWMDCMLRLSELPELVSLAMVGCDLEDENLQPICRMEKLRELQLGILIRHADRNHFSAEGLLPLTNLKLLRFLTMSISRHDSVGGNKLTKGDSHLLLKLIKELPQLQYLDCPLNST